MTSADYTLDVARKRGQVVVTVQGDLGLAGAIRLGAVLGDLIDGQGNLTVRVDLRRAGVVDPAGLGVLDVAARLARRRGGDVLVTQPAGDRRPPDETVVASGDDNHHLVEFYETDPSLAESVGDYLEPALRDGQAVVVVATPRHRELFEAALAEAGVDVEAARRDGRYLDVDAEKTLSRFMVDGAPDPLRFRRAVGRLVADAEGPGRAVRIYGEMVALLWAEGNVPAAIALEDLWNDLGRSRPFSLLCAYPVSAFDPAEHTGLFRRICDQHSAAVSGGRH